MTAFCSDHLSTNCPLEQNWLYNGRLASTFFLNVQLEGAEPVLIIETSADMFLVKKNRQLGN